jgi:hypothetical protein
MAKKDLPKLAEAHYVDFADIARSRSSIDVYGRLVRNTGFESESSGLGHPTDSSGGLQMALVVGYCDQGRCVRLPEPQLVAMPDPSGPADNCGWDPAQYVVWKSQPKDWNTLHLAASSRTLHAVLTSKTQKQLAEKVIPSDQVIQMFSDCISHVTGSNKDIDLANTLLLYGFDTQHLVDTFSSYVIGSASFGLPHYGYSMSANSLNWVTNGTQLGGLLTFIQQNAS